MKTVYYLEGTRDYEGGLPSLLRPHVGRQLETFAYLSDSPDGPEVLREDLDHGVAVSIDRRVELSLALPERGDNNGNYRSLFDAHWQEHRAAGEAAGVAWSHLSDALVGYQAKMELADYIETSS